MPIARRKNRAAEQQPLVDKLARDLDAGDTEQVLADLRTLAEHTIYSDTHALWQKHQRLRRKAARFLAASLPREEFCDFLKEGLVSEWAVWEGLAKEPELLSTDGLLAVAKVIGLPSYHDTEAVRRRLQEDPDPAITDFMQALIESRVEGEAREGRSAEKHSRTLSTFQIKWGVDDKDISTAVEILARRPDEKARELTREYMRTLPWGVDRQASHALVHALDEDRSPRSRSLLEEALEAHTTPSSFRILLLAAFAEYDALDALRRGSRDLGQATTEEQILPYLNWFCGMLDDPNVQVPGSDLASVAEDVARTPTSNWPFVCRGYLADVVMRMHPGCYRSPNATRFDRFAFGLVRAFSRFRLEHMGCVISIPILIGLGFLLMFLLDLTIGKPAEGLGGVDDIAFCVWIVSAAVTSHTHFSGHESLRERFYLAILYFGAILAFVGGALVIRLAAQG